MRSLFPGNPITKKCGAILELDTLEFASGKKRGRVVVSERHLGEIEHNLCTFRLDQFLERIHAFDVHASTNAQHDFTLPADEDAGRERQIIEDALAGSRGRVSGPNGAAAKLRVPPSTLEKRIKKLRIRKSHFKLN